MIGHANRRLVSTALAAALGTVLACSGFGGESAAVGEVQVKAAFLVNFVKYVEWPSNAPEQAGTPWVIGVWGESPVGGALKGRATDMKVQGRGISVKLTAREDELRDCHVLFIDAQGADDAAKALKALEGLPVLTVGEGAEFLARGGMIAMEKKANKIRLAINLEAARRAQLVLSSRLLGVADTVLGKPHERVP